MLRLQDGKDLCRQRSGTVLLKIHRRTSTVRIIPQCFRRCYPPSYVSWFIITMNTIDIIWYNPLISPRNWTYLHQLSKLVEHHVVWMVTAWRIETERNMLSISPARTGAHFNSEISTVVDDTPRKNPNTSVTSVPITYETYSACEVRTR